MKCDVIWGSNLHLYISDFYRHFYVFGRDWLFSSHADRTFTANKSLASNTGYQWLTLTDSAVRRPASGQ